MKHTYFRAKPVFSLLAVLLAGSLTACSAQGPGNPSASSKTDAALARAVYPQTAPYPNEEDFTDPATGEIQEAFYDTYDAWNADRRARLEAAEGYQDKLNHFLSKSIPELLSGPKGENRVYSPPNVYLALGMLAELTEGSSREQILDLLDAASMEELRAEAGSLWNANYVNDGATSCILASSLWLREDVSYVPATLKQLADTYYTSSYQGEMGSEELNEALRDWLNEQTGGLLEEQAQDLRLDKDTILALASTIYFRAKWSSEFAEGNTRPEVFHGPNQDLTCDFMHQSDSREYYWGNRFSATAKNLESDGAMWLILPDEGISAEELLKDNEVMDFLLARDAWENHEYLTVHLSVPKFDVASNLDLISGLKALGITDVFDENASDFSPLTRETEGLFVSRADHAARVAIDEKGCIAAAYTVMAVCGAGAPPAEEVDFVVNRPFLFAITGGDGLPLFVGIVNVPS